MNRYKEAFVGIDTAKERNAVAVAVGSREGEIRYLGEFDNTPDAVIKLVRKLTERYPQAYGEKWGLPESYPLIAHDCAKRHSALARSLGLGRVSERNRGRNKRRAVLSQVKRQHGGTGDRSPS